VSQIIRSYNAVIVLKSLSDKYFQAFKGLPRDVWALSLVMFINMSGSMVIFYLSLYLTRHMGFSVLEAGRILSGYGIGMLAGTFVGGFCSDRIGSRRSQQLSLLASGLTLFALSQCRSFTSILAAVVVYGVSASALFPANASSIVETCPIELRSRGFALNRLASNLGVAVGPVIGGLLTTVDYRLLFFVDGTTCLLAAASFFFLFPRRMSGGACPPSGAGEGKSIWWRDRKLIGILLGTFGISLIFIQLFGTFPLFMRKEYGFAESTIGPLFSVNTIMIVLFQMVVTHRTEKLRRKQVAAAGTLLLGLGFGLLPFGRGFLYAAMTVAVWSIGEMLIMPTLITTISLRAPSGYQGKYQGLFSLAFSCGYILGPAAGTKIYESLGGTALWLSVAGLAVLISLFFLFAHRLTVARIRP
jgi:predicted MFS family arabinose efflux permease